MIRRPILIIITVLVFLSVFFVPQIFAADPYKEPGDPITGLDDLDTALKTSSTDQQLKEFCAKRQGNQMNLETWYSGKCPKSGDDFDTFTGEGVGFSDIVILDLQERVFGEKDPNKSIWDSINDAKEIVSMIPKDATPQDAQLAINSAREKLFFNQNSSALGQVGKAITFLFKIPPSSTASYLAYVTQNLQKHHIIPDSYAADTNQGVGYSTFSPFLPIWLATRNLAYLGIIAFFIIYGFMMMFRVNLGQKTTITIQLAIPKLIVTLLIITFSYAIVGFVFDLMWVVIYFIFGYLESPGVGLLVTGKFGSLGYLAGGMAKTGFIGSLVINTLVSIPAVLFGFLNLLVGGTIGAISSVVTFAVFGWLITLIMAIAVLIAYGKLFVKLLTSFISVVISLIIAPLVLLGNALPGSTSIGTWLRNIIANLSVFPITMLLLFFSYLLMIQPILGLCNDAPGVIGTTLGWVTGGDDGCSTLFGVKNLVETGNTSITSIPIITPMTAGFDSRGLIGLIGVGLLLMAAKYVDIVKEALKAPPFKFGSELGEALKTSGGIVTGANKKIQEHADTSSGGGQPTTASNTPQTRPEENTAHSQTVDIRGGSASTGSSPTSGDQPHYGS